MLTGLSLAIGGASSAPGVILWDTGEKLTEKHYDLRPYKNRASWEQVPYGITDYQFAGSAVLENEFFYIYFHHSLHDAIFLYAKRDGEPKIWVNEMYKRYYKNGQAQHGHGTRYVKVIKNSSEEVVVEHQAGEYPCISTHRVSQGKPWVEIRAIKDIHTQGIHGKTRIDIVPVEGGNDYVIDSLRHPKAYYKPADEIQKGKMVLCLYESVKYPFMWVFTFPSLAGATPSINCDSVSGGPRTDAMSWWLTGDGQTTPPEHWFSEHNWPRRSSGCIASTHAAFGKDMKKPVVIGALTYWHNWNREELNRPIKAGEEYRSKWKPPYPGRWRMTVRIAKKEYDQGWEYDGKTVFEAKYFSRDVYDGDFTFKSPVDGVLDYVIMYMYDRTSDTPPEILTPMDQYRWMIEE